MYPAVAVQLYSRVQYSCTAVYRWFHASEHLQLLSLHLLLRATSLILGLASLMVGWLRRDVDAVGGGRPRGLASGSSPAALLPAKDGWRAIDD